MDERTNFKEIIQELLEETEDTEILCFVYTVLKNLLK